MPSLQYTRADILLLLFQLNITQ
uniref:Uncharacterized protein n=1 Tax=Anguilla anguilla TaxID=7936 RepID=A0A0E9VH99_ANGAN